MFFVVVFFLYIAYATKTWEISQGLEIKNHPCGRKRAQSYQLFISFFAPLK